MLLFALCTFFRFYSVEWSSVTNRITFRKNQVILTFYPFFQCFKCWTLSLINWRSVIYYNVLFPLWEVGHQNTAASPSPRPFMGFYKPQWSLQIEHEACSIGLPAHETSFLKRIFSWKLGAFASQQPQSDHTIKIQPHWNYCWLNTRCSSSDWSRKSKSALKVLNLHWQLRWGSRAAKSRACMCTNAYYPQCHPADEKPFFMCDWDEGMRLYVAWSCVDALTVGRVVLQLSGSLLVPVSLCVGAHGWQVVVAHGQAHPPWAGGLRQPPLRTDTVPSHCWFSMRCVTVVSLLRHHAG